MGSLERTVGSLLGIIRPSSYITRFSSVLPALAYQIIKMIALKSNSQVNGTLPSAPLH